MQLSYFELYLNACIHLSPDFSVRVPIFNKPLGTDCREMLVLGENTEGMSNLRELSYLHK